MINVFAADLFNKNKHTINVFAADLFNKNQHTINVFAADLFREIDRPFVDLGVPLVGRDDVILAIPTYKADEVRLVQAVHGPRLDAYTFRHSIIERLSILAIQCASEFQANCRL